MPMDTKDPEAIASMLEFVYTGDYDNPKHTEEFHLAVYSLSNFVDMSGLRCLAERKFREMATRSWNGGRFPACVETVYDITSPNSEGDFLRSVAVQIAAENATALSTLNIEVASFGKDLSKVLCRLNKLTYKDEGSDFTCAVCNFAFKATIPENVDESNWKCMSCGIQ